MCFGWSLPEPQATGSIPTIATARHRADDDEVCVSFGACLGQAKGGSALDDLLHHVDWTGSTAAMARSKTA